MHELYYDCLEAWETLEALGIPNPPWIHDVMTMPFVNGEFPHEHVYDMRPAA